MGVNRKARAYRIRIKGHLDSSWSAWLGGATVLPQPDGETILCVSPEGQSALWALLSRLWDLGLPLICVECVSDGGAAAAPAAGTTTAQGTGTAATATQAAGVTSADVTPRRKGAP
jgi:hypothetical protein